VAPAEPIRQARQCRFAAAIGQAQLCPGAECVFWEPGGAVLEGRCAFELLDITDKPELAALLLDLRRALESADSHADAQEVRHHLHRLLNEENGT